MSKFFSFIILTLIYITGCKDNSLETSPPEVAEFTQVDFEPAWNQTATKVAYAHSNVTADLTGIYIINSDGTGNRQIVSDPAGSPCWSPDDSKIVFSQFNQIFKINIAGDSLIQITTDGKNNFPKCNQNGKIAFIHSDSSTDYLYTMDQDGNQKTLIQENVSFANWAAIETLIYFKPIKNTDGSQTGDSLFIHDLSSNLKTLLTVLTSDNKVNMYPVYIGDIAFNSIDSSGYSYVYKFKRSINHLEKLVTNQGYSPEYSYLNNKIIYTNRDKGNGRLWTMDINGNGNVQLTH